jgi:putative acetyltransferase
MSVLIRQLHGNDELHAVLAVHRAAFGREGEASLVEQLRISGFNTFEWVAEENGRIIGHVSFSPIQIERGDDGKALGLAPMAVLPAQQRRGVGSQLLAEALQALRGTAFRAVVVLGDPAYYERFGFLPASKHGLHDTYGGGDAFMAMALHEDGLSGYRGRVDYAPAFANLTD